MWMYIDTRHAANFLSSPFPSGLMEDFYVQSSLERTPQHLLHMEQEFQLNLHAYYQFGKFHKVQPVRAQISL